MTLTTSFILILIILFGVALYVLPRDKPRASRSRRWSRWGRYLRSGPPFKQRPLLKHIAFLLNPNSLPLRRLARLRTGFGTPVIPTKRQNALNKGEGRLLAVLDRIVPEIFGPTARVCPQVSYGEFLSCSKFSKFARMNSRREQETAVKSGILARITPQHKGYSHV